MPEPTLRIRLVDPEDGVLVRVKSDRAAVYLKVSLERFEVAGRALAWHEAQLHQLAGCVVDEDNNVQGSPRFSNQRCSLPPICTNSP
jgi:hypothetical protein